MAKVTTFGEAMKGMLDRKKALKNGLQTAKIEEVWQDVMGQAAKYTDKVQIINSTLFVSSSNGPFKNELFFQRKLIIERVNEAFGEKVVDKVVIN